ncbi:MAG: YncE family protein [Candidatus Schekmanbacteria bacterium]|nr:MAG: YncE family protein [Candidatus Schekmanbacteria bacterium]
MNPMKSKLSLKNLSFVVMPFFFLFVLMTLANAKSRVGYVLNSDYSSGSTISTIKYNGKKTKAQVNQDILSELHSDSIIRKFKNYIFVIARYQGDNVIVLKKNDLTNPLKQYSFTDGTNPQDMVFKNKKTAYVSGLGSNDILVINPLTGKVKKKIDLSDYADSDGLVEAASMIKIGKLLFVSLQRLNNLNYFSASNDSMIAVINIKTNKLVDTITLAGRNPSSMVYCKKNKKIYVSDTGTYDTSDSYGGIEVINPKTLESEGIIITDDSLGGTPGSIALYSLSKGFIVISDSSMNNYVVSFNAKKGSAGSQLSGTSTAYIPKILIDGKFLYVLDRDSNNPGIIVYNVKNNKKVSGPKSTGQLAPADLIL